MNDAREENSLQAIWCNCCFEFTAWVHLTEHFGEDDQQKSGERSSC